MALSIGQVPDLANFAGFSSAAMDVICPMWAATKTFGQVREPDRVTCPAGAAPPQAYICREDRSRRSKSHVMTDNKPHPAVIAAEEVLDAQGVRYCRKSPYQLQLGKLNFYPSKGTIVICGQEAEPIRGKTLAQAVEMAKALAPDFFRIARLPQTL